MINTPQINPQVICPICYRWIKLTRHHGWLHPHGPVHNRCKGSWGPPMPNQVQRAYIESLL